MKYQSAYQRSAERQAKMLLDLLTAAVGFRCSFAWGSSKLTSNPWQVMPEVGADEANPDAQTFFDWHVVNNPDEQWHPSCLEAAHAFHRAWRRWRVLGKPRMF